MRYYRLFLVVSGLSALVGVGAAAFSERRVVYWFFVAASCAVVWWRELGGRRAPVTGAVLGEALSWPMRVVLAGGLLAFTLADYFLLGVGLFLTLGHLLDFAIVLKLTGRRGPRDYYQVFLLSFFNLVVAGYISAHFLFGVFLAGFAVFTGWALMLLVVGEGWGVWRREPRRDYAARTVELASLQRLDGVFGSTLGRVLGRGGVYSPALLGLAALLFLFAPRGRGNRVHLPTLNRYRSITGFTDRVQLGEMANILQNPEPVMRVELLDPVTGQRITEPRVPLLWRGLTLDEYRKQRTWGWYKRPGREMRYVSGRPLFRAPPLRKRDLIRQRIILEPIDSPYLFALHPLLSVSAAENVGAMRVDESDLSVRMVDPAPKPRQYEAVSLRFPLPRRERLDQRYLQVPAEIRPVLRRYAERIAPDRLYPTPAAKAGAMVRHFHSHRYTYSLTYRGRPGVEPVTDFLTRTRRGHCELFASAMALMLRTQGVYTRLVAGFRGGQWSTLGNYLLVTQEDAHTWVEVYIPGQGWRAYDPTPGSRLPRPMRTGSLLGYLGQLYDYLKWSWMQNVLRYDRRRQRAVIRRVADFSAFNRTMAAWNRRTVLLAWRWWRGWLRVRLAGLGLPEPGEGLIVALTAVVALLGLGLPGFLLLRRFGRYHSGPIAPVAFYARLLRLLAGVGFERRPAQTPLEFANSLVAIEPHHLALVPQLTQLYYRVRFGGMPLQPEEERQVSAMLEELTRSVASIPRR